MNKDQKAIFKGTKGVDREARKKAGYFDGRFAPRVVESKKHRKPKYKHKIFDE
jgi:hypothetical protein